MILVLNANGTTGSLLVEALARKGAPVRAAVRDVGRAAARFGPSVEVVAAELSDGPALERAFRGVRRVFLASPAAPELVEREAHVLAAAKAARVEHLVRIGGIRVDRPSDAVRMMTLHAQGQDQVRRADVPYTFLRPNFFLQNLLGQAASLAEGALVAPTGGARFSFVDAVDIADAAATVLTTPGHLGRTYDLTGDEPLSMADVARVLGEVLGRSIVHVDVPDASFRQGARDAGVPAWLVDRFAELYAEARRSDWFAATSPDLLALVGRPAVTLRAFAARHRGALGGAPETRG